MTKVDDAGWVCKVVILFWFNTKSKLPPPQQEPKFFPFAKFQTKTSTEGSQSNE
jgi:hypothetical protein